MLHVFRIKGGTGKKNKKHLAVVAAAGLQEAIRLWHHKGTISRNTSLNGQWASLRVYSALQHLLRHFASPPLLFNTFKLSCRRVCVCLCCHWTLHLRFLSTKRRHGFKVSHGCLVHVLGGASFLLRADLAEREKKKIKIFFFLPDLRFHVTDLLAVDFLLDEELHLLHVFRGVVGATGGRQPVSAGSPGLLVVAGQGLGQVPVSYKSAREDETPQTRGGQKSNVAGSHFHLHCCQAIYYSVINNCS